MEFEDYIRLGNLLKDAYKLMLTHKKPNRSKTKRIGKEWRKCLHHMIELKNHLDEMVAIEYPTLETTDIFYGEDKIKIYKTKY